MNLKKTLKLRITVWYALFMLLLTVVFLWLVMVIVNIENDESVQNQLINTVDTVYQQIDGSRNVRMDTLLQEDIEHRFIGIYSDDGDLMAGTEPAKNENILPFVEGELQSMIINYEVYYIYDRIAETKDGNVWVRGYVRSFNSKDTQLSLEKGAVIALPLLTITMLVGGWFLTNKMLKPLNNIIKESDAITDADDLNSRIQIPEMNDEIKQLGMTINSMLERLEKSFQREKQFSTDVSHELRTPVAVILAQCELVEESDMTIEEYHQAFNVVNRQTSRMKQLVEDLLQLGRIDNGHIKLNLMSHNLSDIIRILIEEQKLLYGSKDDYVTEIEDDIFLHYDENLLTRAVRNLLNNAHQYGNGWIKVTLKRNYNNVLFIVEDNGQGIHPDNIDKIWNRFYQENGGRSYQGGAGLGLPMVKNIITLHDGTVSVDSTIEEGTCFTITIPIK